MNYRKIFFEHNDAPWHCHFCKEEMTFNSILVHHIDEDRKNNDHVNLVAVHHRCHTSHHAKGRYPSFESRAKMSASMKGVPKSLEHRAKLRVAVLCKILGPHSPETRANISAAKKGRSNGHEGMKHTEETRAKMSVSMAGIKHGSPSPEHRAKLSAANKGKMSEPARRGWETRRMNES